MTPARRRAWARWDASGLSVLCIDGLLCALLDAWEREEARELAEAAAAAPIEDADGS